MLQDVTNDGKVEEDVMEEIMEQVPDVDSEQVSIGHVDNVYICLTARRSYDRCI